MGFLPFYLFKRVLVFVWLLSHRQLFWDSPMLLPESIVCVFFLVRSLHCMATPPFVYPLTYGGEYSQTLVLEHPPSWTIGFPSKRFPGKMPRESNQASVLNLTVLSRWHLRQQTKERKLLLLGKKSMISPILNHEEANKSANVAKGIKGATVTGNWRGRKSVADLERRKAVSQRQPFSCVCWPERLPWTECWGRLLGGQEGVVQ